MTFCGSSPSHLHPMDFNNHSFRITSNFLWTKAGEMMNRLANVSRHHYNFASYVLEQVSCFFKIGSCKSSSFHDWKTLSTLLLDHWCFPSFMKGSFWIIGIVQIQTCWTFSSSQLLIIFNLFFKILTVVKNYIKISARSWVQTVSHLWLRSRTGGQEEDGPRCKL